LSRFGAVSSPFGLQISFVLSWQREEKYECAEMTFETDATMLLSVLMIFFKINFIGGQVVLQINFPQ
jgi:hypothetical protein